MTRFVAVWSLQRGIIDPPEPLDDAGQRLANLEAQNDAQEAYRAVRYERDPPLTEEQRWIEELGRRTVPKQTRAKCA
jgi:hypothetical protein